MSETMRPRKSSVIFAMTLIRPLFKKHGCDADAYSDEQLADALLDAHSHLATDWLSPEHMSRASQWLPTQGHWPLVEPPRAETPIPRLKSKASGSS